MTAEDTAGLAVFEALELLRARIAAEAGRLGARFVVLKGRALSVHGWEAPRVASDVDVLMTPQDAMLVDVRLKSLGWKIRPWEDPDGIFPQHSTTYYHPRWPVDLDLHFRFPGCEAETSKVLDVFLEEATYVREAGTDVPVTGSVGTVLVGLLNALRNGDMRGQAFINEWIARGGRDPDPYELVHMARRVDALGALRPLLASQLSSVDLGPVTPPSDNWLIYSLNSESASIRIEHLLSTRPRAMPALIWRAVWPSRNALAATDLRALDMPASDLLATRLRRLWRAGRNGRKILAEIIDYREHTGRSKGRGVMPDEMKVMRHGD